VAWVEQRGGRWLLREWRDGHKVTIRSFIEERDARYWKLHGEGFPMTASEALDRLQQGMKSRKKPGPRLSRYAFEVIENDPNIADESRSPYLATVRNHVEGSVIDVPLDRIEPTMVRKFWANLTPMKSYAANGNGMKNSVYKVLNKVLTQAVRDGVIQTNPLVRANIKRPTKKPAIPREPLTIDEVEELAAACLTERDRLMILAGGYCGLRGGEVGGLRLKDIDPKACRFSIMQAVKGRGSKKHLGLPKGDKTRRITVPCSLSREIVKFGRKNAASDGRIFHTNEGFIDSRRTTLVSQEAAKRAGFREVWFHLLRHTTASLLVDDGASIKDVQEYLGIATAAILLDTYTHAFEGRDQRVADRLEARRTEWREKMKSH